MNMNQVWKFKKLAGFQTLKSRGNKQTIETASSSIRCFSNSHSLGHYMSRCQPKPNHRLYVCSSYTIRHCSSNTNNANKVTFPDTKSSLNDNLSSTQFHGSDSLQQTSATATAPAVPISEISEEPQQPPLIDNTISEGIEYIPAPPSPPIELTEVCLNSLGEPTFSSLGLGGWTPIGLMQHVVEFFHVTGGLPWWGAIAVTTVCVRTLLFPLVIKSQKQVAKMTKYMPQIQAMQLKITEARKSGNQLDTARLSYEMQQFMQKHDISPFRQMMVPLAQAPIFISIFIGLRRCANLPVESMKEGGIFWFTNLTIADPYYLLPVITSATLLAAIELGADGMSIQGEHRKIMRYIMRGIPILIFPFTFSFPAAILCYWVSTNAFSLCQVALLRVPSVRKALNLEQLVKHKPESLPMSAVDKKGFVESVKDSYTNMKVSREIADRHNIDELRYKRAGSGPVLKTYKTNPVLKTGATGLSGVKAKQRD